MVLLVCIKLYPKNHKKITKILMHFAKKSICYISHKDIFLYLKKNYRSYEKIKIPVGKVHYEANIYSEKNSRICV